MSQAASPRHPGPLHLDHVIVAARTLADGVAWCEASLGITPTAGGEHRFMGTHNRVFSIASARFPLAYLEIIAIDPQAAPPPHARWFDLDDAALKRAIRNQPQLIHWVARSPDIVAAAAAFRAGGFDPGALHAAERASPAGLLRWQISLPADGRRLRDGALPTLIAWNDRHPGDTLTPSGVVLEEITLAGLPHSFAALFAPAITIAGAGLGVSPAAPPPIRLRLATPRGVVELQSIRTGASI